MATARDPHHPSLFPVSAGILALLPLARDAFCSCVIRPSGCCSGNRSRIMTLPPVSEAKIDVPIWEEGGPISSPALLPDSLQICHFLLLSIPLQQLQACVVPVGPAALVFFACFVLRHFFVCVPLLRFLRSFIVLSLQGLVPSVNRELLPKLQRREERNKPKGWTLKPRLDD